MPYRDESLVCIELGSYETRAVFGLAESLTPPKYKIRTQIAQVDGTEEYAFGDEVEAAQAEGKILKIIDPIVRGEIVDWAAFTAFVTRVLNSFDPGVPGFTPSDRPVILVVPPRWAKQDREKVTQLFLRNLMRPAFMIVDSAFASLYACNAVTGLVIDVGHEQTNVTSIVDSILSPSSHRVIDVGGKHMTESLLAMLQRNPPLDQSTQMQLAPDEITFDLAESVKRSDVCEILPDAFGSGTMAFQTTEPEEKGEDGVLDIAAVLASGKTKEYLAKMQANREGTGAAQQVVPNAQLTHNTATIGDKTVVIGSDRFKAADVLVESDALLDAVFNAIVITGVEPGRRHELWENIVIVGNGARVKGFREKLIQNLQLRYASQLAQAPNEQYPHALYPIYPTTIRSLKIPVHFPEWNGKTEDDKPKGTNEEATFLGGCIMAHIAFSSSETSEAARLYSIMADYSEAGPVEVS